jgi:16S rRNA (cytidine1402-2'-O)-methyltransferase
MDDLLAAFGPDRPMALCRELTKDYEEIRRGSIAEIHRSVVDNPPRGEIVLVIGGADDETAAQESPDVLSIDALAALAAERSKAQGIRVKDAIAKLVVEHPLPDGSLASRKEVYAAVLALRDGE